jgi:hypothetical protein
MAVSMKFRIVFWDVLPCKMIVDRRFRGTCCLHHQGWSSFYMAVHPRRQFWNACHCCVMGCGSFKTMLMTVTYAKNNGPHNCYLLMCQITISGPPHSSLLTFIVPHPCVHVVLNLLNHTKYSFNRGKYKSKKSPVFILINMLQNFITQLIFFNFAIVTCVTLYLNKSQLVKLKM